MRVVNRSVGEYLPINTFVTHFDVQICTDLDEIGKMGMRKCRI